MSYKDKVAENKMVAERCLVLKAYNAGVARAYYSAFQHIKDYLISKGFDYGNYLRRTNPDEKEYSHGTLQGAVTQCLMDNGKKPHDVYKLTVFGNMYKKRRKADYEDKNIVEVELKDSLNELNTVMSVVA